MASETVGSSKPKADAIEELTSVFELLDLEGNGDLDLSEFKLGLTSVGLKLSHEDAIQLYQSIDAENVGYIDRDMFVSWLKRDCNSELIENIRHRLREITSNKNVNKLDTSISNVMTMENDDYDDDDDSMMEFEIREITRKQSVRHPESLIDDKSDKKKNDSKTKRKNSKHKKHKRSSKSKDNKNESDSMSDSNNNNNKIENDNKDGGDNKNDLLSKYNEMKDAEKRRLTRRMESRHVIHNENESQFSMEDIRDIAGEMLEEMNRLRRESNESSAMKNDLKEINNIHGAHAFSDSIDESIMNEIASKYSNNIDTMNEMDNGYDINNDDMNNDSKQNNNNNINGYGMSLQAQQGTSMLISPPIPTTLEFDTTDDPFSRKTKNNEMIYNNNNNNKQNSRVSEMSISSLGDHKSPHTVISEKNIEKKGSGISNEIENIVNNNNNKSKKSTSYDENDENKNGKMEDDSSNNDNNDNNDNNNNDNNFSNLGSIVIDGSKDNNNNNNNKPKLDSGARTVDVFDMDGDDLEDIALMKEVFLSSKYNNGSESLLINNNNINNNSKVVIGSLSGIQSNYIPSLPSGFHALNGSNRSLQANNGTQRNNNNNNNNMNIGTPSGVGITSMISGSNEAVLNLTNIDLSRNNSIESSHHSHHSGSHHSHHSGSYVFNPNEKEKKETNKESNENELIQLLDENAESLKKRWFFSFLKWYLEPIYKKNTLLRLGYHGCNLLFCGIFCNLLLFILGLSIITLITCCFGLLLFYYLFELSRIIGKYDMILSLYFFNDIYNNNKYRIYIPISHSNTIINKLRDYATDSHMLEITFYLLFLKIPCCIILSGISLVLFGGVTAIILTPLVFWIDPNYFNNGEYCLFGSKNYDNNNNNNSNNGIECSGWSLDSFGSTIAAFLLFLPILPLTLHLCRFTAKLLFRITCNFLTAKVGI